MFFDYRGAFAYRMRAGMGDIVFAPYYEVLSRAPRNVDFKFFHRVTDLEPSADGRWIESISGEQQVQLAEGSPRYEPLDPVRGLPCWPAEFVHMFRCRSTWL